MDATSTEYIATPKRVVLGNINNQGNASPISPMANLKLLIKVATSDGTYENLLETSEKKVKYKYTRQLRSLGFICKKFLQIYTLDLPDGRHMQLSLVNLSHVLEIEKRRIYDIINVVASLNMAVKVCKDRYIWYGNQHLSSMLSKLKIYALQNNLDQLVKASFFTGQPGTFNNELEENITFHNFSNSNSNNRSVMEDNRIGILCQKFVMLFLVSPEGSAINLNIISKLILPRDIRDKTGMRRLYDIANVLESLGVIKRHCATTVRKPSFVYCGPYIPSDKNELITLSSKINDQPLNENSDSSDSFSSAESGKEDMYNKFHDMLEVVCKEIDEIDKVKKKCESHKRLSMDGGLPTARKKLFLQGGCGNGEENREYKKAVGSSKFIKAPEHSFRLLCNKITEKPSGSMSLTEQLNVVPIQSQKLNKMSIHNKTNEPSVELNSDRNQNKHFQLQDLSSNLSGCKDSKFPVIKLNKIRRPITIYKPVKLSAPNIQNGDIYKAVKKGNTIHLVKL